MKNPGIYILTSPSDKQYVGKDSNLPSRVRDHLSGNSSKCPTIHDAIQKYGRDVFSVEIIQYPGISEESLSAVERWWIRRLQTLTPRGYNLTEGGEGLFNPSPETREKMRASACRDQKKRLADGTHNFLGGEIQKKRVADGTHNFLGGEIQKKRVADGTHNFLGKNNPVHKQIADGTHHLLGGEIARRSNQKRVADGTHNFLGKNNPVHKQIADGTHPFLDSEFQRRNSITAAKKRTLKRIKGEWCYIIALSRFWYETHDYTLKRRKEFLSKDIPDLSNAEQTYLF